MVFCAKAGSGRAGGRAAIHGAALAATLAVLLLVALMAAPASAACTTPRAIVGTNQRDPRLTRVVPSPAQADAARRVISQLTNNGFADLAPTTTQTVLRPDATTGVDLRVTEVATTYMDDGTAPLTDNTGKPIKHVTVAVTLPPPSGTGPRVTVAMVQVPAGYRISAAAIRTALVNSLSTSKAQSFLPPAGVKMASLAKEFSLTTSTQGNRWTVAEGGINSGAIGAAGTIRFDDQGDAFSTQEFSYSTSVSSTVTTTVAGFPFVSDTNVDPNTGTDKVCKRQIIAQRPRYYCRRQQQGQQ